MRTLAPETAAGVILEDITVDPQKSKVFSSIVAAVQDSIDPKTGVNHFGDHRYVGAVVFAQVYGAKVIGRGCDASLQERVHGPLGFELVGNSGETGSLCLSLYEHMGKLVRNQPLH